jgi:hypothetical protein
MSSVIDLASAQIVNAPDIRLWRETAKITRVSFDGSTTRIAFDKQDGANRWPDVRPPGWDGDLQYTIWLFLQVRGKWVGSAFVQMWHGRDGSGSAADPDVPSKFHEHWYYGTRWAPMDEHGPIQTGELIGFMVSSGNARDSLGPFGPKERSNIVVVKASDKATYTYDDAPAQHDETSEPIRIPTPATGASLAAAADLQAVMAKLAMMDAKLDEIAATAARVNKALKEFPTGGLPK